MVYVTHDREDAFAMSDRIGVLRAGRLLQEGDGRTLYEASVDTSSPGSSVVGYLPADPDIGPILYEVIATRYEKKATVITSNKSPTGWGGSCTTERSPPPSSIACSPTARSTTSRATATASGGFLSLADARRTIEAGRQDYNTLRPHSALGSLTPEEFEQPGPDRMGF